MLKNISFTDIPIITIDGHSGSGKGTLGKMLASSLKWHYLDSGALYRIVALLALRNHLVNPDQDANINDQSLLALLQLVKEMDINFVDEHIYLLSAGDKEDINPFIRNENIGKIASKLASIISIREALLGYQRHCLKVPGLVADGRDMGTVVFPQASVKLFLTASPQERARRRHKQLLQQGESVSMRALVDQLTKRDQDDASRQYSPLKAADDAHCIDSSNMNINAVFQTMKSIIQSADIQVNQS